jgi:uncharacterized protein (TIGR03546 family)
MLALIKLLQQLVKTLNSEGTPGQVAAGLALGAALGLTPLMNLHNLVILAAAMLLNVSFPGAMLGWALAIPLGFALDPVFDGIGRALLLGTPALETMWTRLANTPVVPLTNFNNTIVLGSFLSWVVLALPIYFLGRWGVARYRASIYPRLAQTRAFRVVTASKLYNVYKMFRPS